MSIFYYYFHTAFNVYAQMFLMFVHDDFMMMKFHLVAEANNMSTDKRVYVNQKHTIILNN